MTLQTIMETAPDEIAKDENVVAMIGRMVGNAIQQTRSSLSRRLGLQFGEQRDLFETLGYNKNPLASDFKAYYEGDSMSSTIVDAPAMSSWQTRPVIIDEGVMLGSDNQTQFLMDLQALDRRIKLFSVMQKADRLSGVGHYGTLLLGLNGSMETPVLEQGAKTLAYLQAYDEMTLRVETLVKDSSNPRYGMPEYYLLTLDEGTTQRVHHTRVIHIAEDIINSRYKGTPRLKKIFNRVFDLQKVVGGSAEALWLSMGKGLVLSAKEGFDFKDGDAKQNAIDQLEAWTHNIQRYLTLAGVDVTALGTDDVNPKPVFDILISMIAGYTRMPQRLLVGSERGDLASSQDEMNWAAYIEQRRANHVEPNIVRKVIDRLIELGIIAPPQNGEYGVAWKTIFVFNDIERAQIFNNLVQAVNTLTTGMPEEVLDIIQFMKDTMPFYTPSEAHREKED